MDELPAKNTSIHISSKSHLNLTVNLYQCGNNEIPPGGRLVTRAEDVFTLLYINAGCALLEYNNLAYRICAGQGMFAFPDMAYELHNTGDALLDITWLSFSGYLVENYLNRANITRPRPVFPDPEGAVGEKLSRIYAAAHRLPNRYCRMASGLYDIFSYLLDMSPTKQSDTYVDYADFFAVKAVDYIERNYMRAITADEIAGVLGISRKHLYAIFNNILKISPKQYLIYYRIEKACVRLKTSPQSVQEIAESVGYANQFYFAKEFKRLLGVTPTEYRRDPTAQGDIFAYRSFVPTLKDKLPEAALTLPMEEAILSVYTPHTPFVRPPEEKE